MARTYTHTLSLSIGGDTPTWEGECSVSYAVIWGRPAQTYGPAERCYPADPDEIDDIRITHVDGQAIQSIEHGRLIAETLETHIECSDRLVEELMLAAHEEEAADRADAEERRWEEQREERF